MKKQISIITASKKSKIYIENRSINKFLRSKSLDNSKIFIIIDNKISKILNTKIIKDKNFNILKIDGSEKIKSFNYYEKIILKLLQNKINRSSLLISIGGGTIGDLCGYIASTILRGIKFISIPTTLLAQVDSSVGGKNGINTKYGKNLVGTFYQPDLVIIDPIILKTLSKRQIKSGYAEIVKHALIKDKVFYFWLRKNFKKILNLNSAALIYAISKSIKIKAKFINKDEKELLHNASSRAILNFGHTFAHALETVNRYNANLTHGEAVSIGMTIASKISYKLNNLKNHEFDDITKHFKKVGLPTFNKNINNKNFYKTIVADKKNTNNKINLILLKKIGKAYYKKGLNIAKLKDLIN